MQSLKDIQWECPVDGCTGGVWRKSFDCRNKLESLQHVDGLETYVSKKKLTRVGRKEGQHRAVGYCNLLSLIEIEASKGDREKNQQRSRKKMKSSIIDISKGQQFKK